MLRQFTFCRGRSGLFARSVGAVIALLVLGGSSVQADIIYRETFGRTNGATGNLNPSLFGWQHFLASGSAEGGNNGISADNTGKPTDVENVNAGPNLDGSFEAQPEGWHYLDGSRRMSFTPEYSFNPADYEPGSVVFSWHQGNAYTTAGLHLIVRIGGIWYVSVAGITNETAVTSGANFGLETGGAVPVSMAFDPSAAGWNLLNFDGDFDHVTLTRTASTLGAPTVGAPAEGDLAGVITAFGLWRAHDNTGFGNSRFDSFTIEATPDTGTPPKHVRWEGGASADWDTLAANWRTNGGPATTYANRDFARLDDTATGLTTINLAGPLQPGGVTVSNLTLAYQFIGSGSLGGTGGLTKQGSGTLVIANAGANLFSGPILIEQGTVQVGNADTSGSLGSGAITNLGALVLNRSSDLTLNNDIHGTGTLTHEGPGSLTLNGESSYTGATAINQGTLILNGQLTGGGSLTLAAGTTFSGTGATTGGVIASGEVAPGTSPGTLTVGALTLNPGATLTYEAGAENTVGGVNDLLQVNGNLTLNNNDLSVVLLDVPQTGVPYRVVNFTGARSGDFNPAVAVAGGSRFTPALSYDNGAGQVNLTFSGSAAALRWNSSADPNWDLGVSQNWLNLGNSQPDVFYNGDSVLFDDAPVNPFIEIPENVVLKPALVTVDSANNFYTFSSSAGGGRIGGSAALVKNGDSTLTLSTANEFTGPVTVNQGTLVIGHNTALGTPAGATTIASGATLDVGNPLAGANAVNLGAEHVIVGGSGIFEQGAIVNNGFAGQQNALQRVTLTGNTIFGGSSRWDIRAGSGAFLSTGGNAYHLRKIGFNQVNIVNVLVDTNLANIDVEAGQFGIEGTTTSLGNPTNRLTVFSGATVRFTTWANILSKVLVLQDAATLFNTAASNTFGGPITLEGNVTFNIAGTALRLTNVISGSGALSKTTSGSPLFLSASNTYTGPTRIENGTLALAGDGSIEHSSLITVLTTLNAAPRTDGTLSLANGQKLDGVGGINGSLLARSGSTVSPGLDDVGTLTVSNLVTLQGTTYMEVNKAFFIHDQLVAGPILNYGGTLFVTNLSHDFGPLEAGDSFPLFSAVSYTGGFASIVPASPGTGLAWDTSTLTTDGTLRVVTAGSVLPPPRITGASVSGGQLVFSGTNGTAGGTYRVLTHTNVNEALSLWSILGPFNFDGGGNFTFTNGTPSEPRRFYILRVP